MLDRLTFYSLLVSLFLLPWYIIRFNLGPLPLTLLELSIVVTVCLWLASKILAVCMGAWGILKDVVALPSFWWWIWIGLFLTAATIGIFVSPQLRQALGVYKAYIIEPVLLFFVVKDVIRTSQQRYMCIEVLGLTSVVVACLCIGQWLVGWPNLAPAELAQHRASGVFNSANDVGLFIAPILFLAASEAISSYQRSRWAASGWGMIVFLDVVAIILSRSRGALVGLILSGVIFIVLLALVRWHLNWFRWWKLVVVWGLAGYTIATSIYLGLWNHPPHVANPYTRPGFTTLTVRKCTWQGTVAMLRTTPLLGAGLAGFTDRYLQHYTCDAEPLVYPHNHVLTLWSELGLFGALSVFALTALFFFSAAEWLDQPHVYVFEAAGVAVMAYWLIHGTVDVPYFKNDLSALWWVIFGLFAMPVSRFVNFSSD